MRITSPPHEQKLEFHKLRAQGQFPGGVEGWKLYQEWRNRPKPEPEEPKTTAQDELGF